MRLFSCLAAFGFLAVAALAQPAAFEKSITFRATFSKGLNADQAAGDGKLYSAPDYKQQAAAVAGLAGDVQHVDGLLHFRSKNTKAVFFLADKNALPQQGTVSFWLQVDPEKELAPGYCDPLQLTDKDYNNSALWVDFTKDERPRHFRLGVFGELKAWNPTDIPPDKNPAFTQRLVIVQKPPFASSAWTHVVFTYEGLGGGKGKAALYVNGKLQGTSPQIAEAFSWQAGKAALRLGVNYVGKFDDLTVFRQPLTAAQVATWYAAGRK